MRVNIAGELPIVVAVRSDDDHGVWITQDRDFIAMTRDQARQVRDALDKFLAKSPIMETGLGGCQTQAQEIGAGD